MDTKSRTKRAKTISRSLLTWLVVIVLIGFAASIGLSWILQTRLSNRSAEEVLRINIADVQQDIQDKSDMNLLELTREIAGELPEGQAATSGRLRELMKQHDVSEINVINDQGFITASTEEAFLGYDIRDGRAAFIPMEADLMLAGMEGTAYEEQRLQMKPGDILFLYTDGVTEAANEREEMFGEERLLEVLSASFGKGEEACRKICGTLKEEIDRFAGDAAQTDDITMLCLYYAGRIS